MKIKEIQKKFGNKFAVRVLTGVLTAALLAGSYGMGYMRGVQPDEQISVVAVKSRHRYYGKHHHGNGGSHQQPNENGFYNAAGALQRRCLF